MVAPENLLKSITSNRHHQRCGVVNLKNCLNLMIKPTTGLLLLLTAHVHCIVAASSLHDQYTIKIYVQLSLKRALIFIQRGERGIGNSRP